jgi:hypothetical protein
LYRNPRQMLRLLIPINPIQYFGGKFCTLILYTVVLDKEKHDLSVLPTQRASFRGATGIKQGKGT